MSRYPSNWEFVQIGDIADLIGGGTPSRSVGRYFQGAIPWLTGYDLPENEVLSVTDGREYITQQAIRASSTNLVPINTVLLTTRVTVGKSAVTETPLCFSQDLTGIVLGDLSVIDPYYVAYFLMAHRAYLLRFNRGSTIVGITRSDVAKVEIPLPPLPEQQRIVTILRYAADLRHQRREADELAQMLLPALFDEMFGDPASNPKGWNKKPLAKVGELDRGRSRHRPRDAAHLYGGPYPFVQTGDISNSQGWITEYHQTYSAAGLAQSRMWPENTLAITIAANIARTGILTFDACFPDSVVGFVPGSEVKVEFVRQWFETIQSQLEAMAPQGAQKNINLEILRALRIIVPPIELQEKYVQVSTEMRSIGLEQIASQKPLEELFQSLLARAFSGELTEVWRDKHKAELSEAAEQRDQWVKGQGLKTTESRTGLVIQQPELARHQRHSVLRELQNSPEQWLVYQIVAQTTTPFTVQNIAEDSNLPVAAIRRHLALLHALGIVGRANYQLNTSEQFHYAPLYRLLTEVDNARTADLTQLQQVFSATVGPDSL